MATCLYCTAPLADLGRYCSGCYSREIHADASPLVLGDPADPWREYNAEADRAIADQKLHTILAPRMAARWFSPSRSRPGNFGLKIGNAKKTERKLLPWPTRLPNPGTRCI